jgi:hypothetical protein
MPELALPYVPIDPRIVDSERMGLFLDAIDAHSDPMAPWHVVKLLLWTGQHRPDGNLRKLSAKRIAIICAWPGEPDELVQALKESGWVIEVDGGGRLEGWERHGGMVLKQREDYRERERLKKKRQRCAKKGHPPETCECPDRVPEMSPGADEAQIVESTDVPDVSPERPRDVPVMKVKGEGEYTSTSSSSRETREHLSADEVLEIAKGWTWTNTTIAWGKHQQKAVELSPYTPAEVESARVATEAVDGNPNLGLWLAKIKQGRRPRGRSPPREGGSARHRARRFSAADEGKPEFRGPAKAVVDEVAAKLGI